MKVVEMVLHVVIDQDAGVVDMVEVEAIIVLMALLVVMKNVKEIVKECVAEDHLDGFSAEISVAVEVPAEDRVHRMAKVRVIKVVVKTVVVDLNVPVIVDVDHLDLVVETPNLILIQRLKILLKPLSLKRASRCRTPQQRALLK